jgi:hypothetical protein
MCTTAAAAAATAASSMPTTAAAMSAAAAAAATMPSGAFSCVSRGRHRSRNKRGRQRGRKNNGGNPEFECGHDLPLSAWTYGILKKC